LGEPGPSIEGSIADQLVISDVAEIV